MKGRENFFSAGEEPIHHSGQYTHAKQHRRCSDKKISYPLVQTVGVETMVHEAELSRRRIRSKESNAGDAMTKEFREEHVSTFMNGRAYPGGPQNAFPPDALHIGLLGPFLKLGQSKTKQKKTSKERNELDKQRFFNYVYKLHIALV